MSVLSSLAQLFARSAVPSIESTLSQGADPARAAENIRNLLGPNVQASQQLITSAIGRVQQALQRGAAIERGETVPRQQIPVDPTLPIDTEFRYRVRIQAEFANPQNPRELIKVDSVIPIDSDKQLSLSEIRQLALPAARDLLGEGRYPRLATLGIALTVPTEVDTTINVVSVYRNAIG